MQSTKQNNPRHVGIETPPGRRFTCQYCGNNNTLLKRFGNAFEPDFVIPFHFDREEALKRYHEDARNKPFIPDGIDEPARIVSEKDIYTQLLLFNGDAACTRKNGIALYRSPSSRNFSKASRG